MSSARWPPSIFSERRSARAAGPELHWFAPASHWWPSVDVETLATAHKISGKPLDTGRALRYVGFGRGFSASLTDAQTGVSVLLIPVGEDKLSAGFRQRVRGTQLFKIGAAIVAPSHEVNSVGSRPRPGQLCIFDKDRGGVGK